MAKPRTLQDIDQLYNKIDEVTDKVGEVTDKVGEVTANLQAQIGSLPALETQDKSDLVSAINELTTKVSKVDTADNLSVELEKKVDKDIISDAYDELKTYVVGEYCIYNNSLWKCLVQNNGQTPTEGTYWTNVTVANEIVSVNSSLSKQGQYEVLGNFNSTGTFTLNKSINDFNYICMISRYENITLIVETLPSKFVGTEIFNLVYNVGNIREVDVKFLSSSSVNIFTFKDVSNIIILGFN